MLSSVHPQKRHAAVGPNGYYCIFIFPLNHAEINCMSILNIYAALLEFT